MLSRPSLPGRGGPPHARSAVEVQGRPGGCRPRCGGGAGYIARQPSSHSPTRQRRPWLSRQGVHRPCRTQPAPCSAGPSIVGDLQAGDMRFGVVVARFNDLVTKLLLEGALDGFQRHGADRDNVVVTWVPGSFELPLVAKSMAKTGTFDAIIVIGVVVRGATTHYEAVVNAAVSGTLNASVDSGVPVIFGVLTCDTMEQALDRAGGKVGNKGFEAAVTAVEMGNLMRTLRSKDLAAKAW